MSPTKETRTVRLVLRAAIVSGVACDNAAGTASSRTSPDSTDAAVSVAIDAAVSDAPSGSVAATYSARGPWTVGTCEVAAASAPCVSPGAATSDASTTALYVVFYPMAPAAGGLKRPIVTWGNGTGATPSQYSVLLTHIASWGFVVVASTSPNTGTGSEMLAGEDYLVAANAQPGSSFYGSLDVAHVGAVGHSQGADGAVQALLAADAPGSTHRAITTAVPIELPAQSWTCYGNSDPSCKMAESFDSKNLVHGSVFLSTAARTP
jgi:hypothetical protein